MDKKIKEYGILGFIVYVLSLPIMIWKSSKIGRIVFLWLFIITCIFGANKLLDVGTMFYAKFQVLQKISPVLKDCELLKSNISRIKAAVEEYNILLSKRLNEKHLEIDQTYNNRFNALNEKLLEIEKGMEIVGLEEKNALKEKIYELRQRIKFEKQSIDKKENRKLLEEICSHTFLLSKEEHERLLKGLEEIGYAVEKTQEGATQVSAYDFRGRRMYGCVTGSTIFQSSPQVIIIDEN